ncbi:MAG: hypothetical protein HWE20_00550 [Gammaproteobacteria bacterium]|nr:hypothetical protein [Gammaproteobacteria bacterium]
MRLGLRLPIALVSLALVSGCVESTGDVVGAAKLQNNSATLFISDGERPEPVSIALTDSDYWLRPQSLPSADIISLRNGRAIGKKVHLNISAPAQIPVGTHTETLLLDICRDSTCGALVSNSPLTYTVTITNAYDWREDPVQSSTVKALLVAERYGNEIASILADQLSVWVDTAELWEAETTKIAGDRLLRQLASHTSKVSIVDLADAIRATLPEDRFVDADSLGIAYNLIDDGLLSASDITDLWGYYFEAVDQVAKLVDAAQTSQAEFFAETLPYLQAFNLNIEDTESLEAYRQAVGFNYSALYESDNEIQGFSDLANTFEMCSSEARKDWIVEHLHEKYYWNTNLPAQIDTSDASESWRDIFYANLDARDQDKEGHTFSWIAGNEFWYDFLQGSDSGIGVAFVRTQNNTLIASRIHADGNGYRYGLRRGDEVVFVGEIDAEPVQLTRLSDNRSFSIPKSEYAQDAFIGPLFTERANQTVAYLNLYAFNMAAYYQIDRVYQALIDGAPDSLNLRSS